MKKILKILGVAAAVAGVVLALASVALHVLLPKEKAKAMVLKQLSTHLKREVRVGDVSVGILSGLKLAKLEVSESPSFAKGTFVSSDGFSVRLALLPLLFKRVEVKELILDHPVIQLVRHPDGSFNFSDLVSSATAKSGGADTEVAAGPGFLVSVAHAAPPPVPAAPKETMPAFALVISQAQIKDGVVHFLDRSPAKQSVDIDSLDLKLKNVSLTSPFGIQVFLKAKARGVAAALKMAGEADIGTGSFKLKTCDLSSGGSTLTLEGKASQLKSQRPSVDLVLRLKEFKLSTFAPFIALPRELKLEGPIVGDGVLKGDQKKMDFSIQLDMAQVQAAYARQFSKPARVPFGVSLKGRLSDLQDVHLSDVKGTLGSLELKGYGKILAVNSAQPQVGLHVESNPFQVTELAGFMPASLPQGLAMKGVAQLAADVSGTQASSHLAAKCEAKDLEVTYGDKFKKPAGMPFRIAMSGEAIRGAARPAGRPKTKQSAAKPAASAGPQTLNIQSLAATLGSIELTGKGAVQTEAQPPRFDLTFKSNTFSLADVSKMVPLLSAYRLGGSASTEGRASGSAEAPQINGALQLQGGSLRYEQSELTQLATHLTFTQQDLTIPKLTGKLNGSDISMKLTGRRLTTQPEVTVDADIAELDLAKLMPPAPAQASQGAASWVSSAWAAAPPAAAPPMKLAGQLKVGRVKHEFYDARELDLQWNLTDVTPDLARVGGTAALKQGPGVLKDVEKLAASMKSARVALEAIVTLQKLEKKGLLQGLNIPSFQTIKFKDIRGDYLFRSGVLDIKNFELLGSDRSIHTVGTVGLAGEQLLDMRVTIKMAAELVRGLAGDLLSNASGQRVVPFTIKGTSVHPDVKLDVAEMGRNAINSEAGRKAINKIGEQIFKKYGQGGQPSQAPASNPPDNVAPSEPAQPPSSSPPPDPAKDLEKALKSIFK